MRAKSKSQKNNQLDAEQLQDPERFVTSQLDIDSINDYLKLLRSPFKMLWLNVFIGVARGLGFTLGTTVVLAIVYKLIKHMIAMNVPYITEMLREFLETIQPITIGGSPGF